MKGKKVLLVYEDKNPWKNLRQNDKNLDFESGSVKEREIDPFEKVWIVKNTWKTQVLKILWTIFDWSKKRFDRSKMLRLIQHQTSTYRNRQKLTKILIAILIGWEIGSIDRNSRKNKILKIKAILCKNSSKHWILWIKCMNVRWNAFQKHLFWTQFSPKKKRFSFNSP